jgi:hypothetical protein
MNIMLESRCKFNPNNKVMFSMDFLSNSVRIETKDGVQFHCISISRYEFEAISKILMQIPLDYTMEQLDA